MTEPKTKKKLLFGKVEEKKRTWQGRYLGELIRKESLVEGGGAAHQQRSQPRLEKKLCLVQKRTHCLTGAFGPNVKPPEKSGGLVPIIITGVNKKLFVWRFHARPCQRSRQFQKFFLLMDCFRIF